MKLFNITEKVFAPILLKYNPGKNLWEPNDCHYEPRTYIYLDSAISENWEDDYDVKTYYPDSFDCPVKNISAENVYGNPKAILVHKYLDDAYDYSKEGILVEAIYECEKSISLTICE